MQVHRRRSAQIALALSAALAVTATGAQAATPNLGYANAQLKAWSKTPTFKAPGPPFDASKAKGKHIFLIPQISTVPFVAQMDEAIIKVAKSMGIKITEYTNQGKPAQWVQGMNQAIKQKADLIILGAAPELLQPQLKAAKKAGIPVVALHLYDKAQPKPPNVTAFTLAPFTLGGKLEADWAIADSKGKANVLIVNFSDQPPTKYIIATIKKEFATYCGSGCKTTSITLPATDMGTKLQPAVQSALIKDPSINYVFPLYDSATQFVLPAIQAAGRNGKVKTAAYNGTPFVLKYMQTGDTVGMDAGESIDWIGYEAMDQALRILTGHKPAVGFETPVRVWVKSNVALAGDPPKISTGYGTSYVTGYRKLWGAK